MSGLLDNVYVRRQPQMKSDTRIACVKVTRPETHGNAQMCIYALGEFDSEAEFDGSDEGDKITLEFCVMTQGELDNLPDFEGW